MLALLGLDPTWLNASSCRQYLARDEPSSSDRYGHWL